MDKDNSISKTPKYITKMKKNGYILLGGLFLMIIISNVESEKLIIDTDGGGDDAMGISMVLSRKIIHTGSYTKFDILAITCVYGNTILSNVEMNVLKTLTIANATNIPVYSGARKPLMSNFTSDNFFGMDGFGDFIFEEKITLEIDRSKHASVALVELAKKYKGELSILLLGPTTNIAIAITLDPEFVNNVKRFYIMGGSVSGVGNMRPGVEFNFGMDPESDFILLNSTRGEPSLLLPWETIVATNIPWKWRKIMLGNVNSRVMKFLNQAEAKTQKNMFWRSSDALTTAVMLWPNLIKRSLITNISPIVSGEGRGGLLVDYANKTLKSENVEIVQEVNVDEFKKLLMIILS